MPFAARPRSRLPRLLSTTSLRLALTFSAIFGLGAALLVAGIDYGLFRFAETEVREDLNHQMSIMRNDAERLGGDELIAMLESQARNRDARRYLFLVVTPDGRTFSNGLARGAVNAEGFRHNLPSKPRPACWPDQKPDMLVLSHTAEDGTLLAIGRDTKHLDELRGGIRTFALWSGMGVIALAILAGLALGYQFLRRLAGVNRSVERIISGDASQRLPAIGPGREFDDLAANLNRMLDRQQAMMDALKTVSEGIAHDLRTPLGRLRNRLEELEGNAADPRKRQAGIELAMEEIDQITALFDSLLALSQLESGRPASQSTPLDAGDLIETVGEIYRPAIEDAGGTLRILPGDRATGPLTVHGTASLLTQALANLVENAMVHADGRPDVTLEARRRGDRVVFTVADRGPGIPETEREKVLRRFYRMDRSRSRPGSGLGLAMGAAVARWHGGELTLSDNRPGLRAELILPAR
ncbi:MAG: HAMP domain-containing histidine kinase [Altererythrobacter sp.]|nr:HAMP domain-containing histidine kinase [Altererythrobacter sp.]OJU60391.1 MAG: two-component sensor histidine kinase [Altererythrobacter sp. 66-12]